MTADTWAGLGILIGNILVFIINAMHNSATKNNITNVASGIISTIAKNGNCQTIVKPADQDIGKV